MEPRFRWNDQLSCQDRVYREQEARRAQADVEHDLLLLFTPGEQARLRWVRRRYWLGLAYWDQVRGFPAAFVVWLISRHLLCEDHKSERQLEPWTGPAIPPSFEAA